MRSTATGLVLRVALPLVSVLIFLATGEIALRAMYPGGGRMTLGAPGYPIFEHINIHDQQRGRLEWGPKKPGVPRVMILGDSITWGVGIRNWQETWPEQLAREMEQGGRPHEFAVLAYPGREINSHLEQYKLWASEVHPDALVYQWYINDIEIVRHRPSTVRAWQEYPWHQPLKSWSYLYYFIDNRLQMFLPPAGRSYDDYILTDFIPGSIEWTEFERYFHGLATRAREAAPIRIMMLYPQVPFSGPYPLQSLHDRLRALAHAESLSIPPVAWARNTGTIVAMPETQWKLGVRLPAYTGPQAIITHPYYARGTMELDIAFHSPLAPGTVAATLEAIDAESHATLASVPLVIGPAGESFQTTHVTLTLPDADGHDVQIAIGHTEGALDLAGIDLRVDYGFEVLDLADTLNTFDTHVSIFDAHPNARAHKVVADTVGRELIRLERR